MDWKAFLTNDAISTYVTFAAGLLVGLAAHVWKRVFRRPAVVELVKQREVDLVTLSEDARSRLKVTFEEHQVEHFYLSVFEVRNTTDRPLENLDLQAFLEEPRRSPAIYEIGIEDPLGTSRKPESGVSVVGGFGLSEFRLRIQLAFLNSSRVEKDRVILKVYSPEPLVVQKLEGGGKGWMSRYFDRVAYNEQLDRLVKESKGPLDMAASLIVVAVLRRWK